MGQRRPVGALENEVMCCLWNSAHPMTPADVCRELDNGLAYTTIMTILTRLWHKGQVERLRRGRAFAYYPLVSEAELRARTMNEVLDRSSNRDAVLARFVDTLSAAEVATLRSVLYSLDRS